MENTYCLVRIGNTYLSKSLWRNPKKNEIWCMEMYRK